VYEKRDFSVVCFSLSGGQLGVGGSLVHLGIKLLRVDFSQSGEIEG
jgi:hypothetical protein